MFFLCTIKIRNFATQKVFLLRKTSFRSNGVTSSKLIARYPWSEFMFSLRNDDWRKKVEKETTFISNTWARSGLYRGFVLGLGKINETITYWSLLTTFEERNIFEAAVEVAKKIGSSLKSNCHSSKGCSNPLHRLKNLIGDLTT